MKKRTIIGLLVIMCTALLCFGFGCNDKPEESSSEPAVVGSIVITNKQAVMDLGDVAMFEASKENIDEDVVWSTSDNTVVTIDENGSAEAIKVGTATITATAGSYSDSFELTVSGENLPTLELDNEEGLALYIGKTFELAPTVKYKGEDVENISFAYTSDNEEVATVAADGTITAVAEGECVITVTAEYRHTVLSGTYKVNVENGDYITLDKNTMDLSTLNHGEYVSEATLTATVCIGGATVETTSLTWTSNNEEVATVENGVVKAVGVGTARVTVAHEALTAYCNITVTKPSIATELELQQIVTENLTLPEYEIADFNVENVTAVMLEGENVYVDGKLDKNVVIGSSDAKTMTVVTAKADYTVSVVVINKIINTKADFENITDSLAKLLTDKDDKSYYYDGYIILNNDIDYENGEFTAMVKFSDCAPDGQVGVFYGSSLANGFRGEFNGNNKKISNFVINSDGVFGNLIDAKVYNLSLVNVVVTSGSSGALANDIYGTSVVENVYVEGKVQLTKEITSITDSAGLFCAKLRDSKVVIKNCVVKANNSLAQNRVAVFGYAFDNSADIFENCAVIGSDQLFGYCPQDEAPYGCWDVATEKTGITVYADQVAYDVAIAEMNGFVKDQEQCVEPDCRNAGKIVLVKEGEENIEIVLPAKGHSFVDGNETCQNGCGAIISETNQEADVMHGYDFSSLKEGDEVVSIKCGENAVEHQNGFVTFENTQASMEAVQYIVTYASDSVIKVNLTLYSALIATADDLLKAHNYQVMPDDKNEITGYFKLVADIDMTGEEWKKENSFGFGKHTWYDGNFGFKGTIDGDNHTINGLEIKDSGDGGWYHGIIYTMSKGGVVKNLTFTNAKTSFGGKLGGFIAGRVQGGTIENVTITVSFNGGYAVDGLINAGGMLLGRLGESGSELVTVNKVTVIAADKSTSNVDSTSPIANASNSDNYVPTKDKLVLNNVTLVGFKTLATWKNGTRLQTVEQLNEHFTCNNVRVFDSVEEMNTVVLDAVETDVKTGIDFASMVSGTIEKVTLNGEEVTTDNGKVSFANEDASLSARKYTITTTDQKKYVVSVTVYSALIATADDLLNAHNYQVIPDDKNEITGYFKLVADIDTTGKEWKKENMFGVGKQGYYDGNFGFKGTIDGDNHTINGLEIKDSGDSGWYHGIIYTMSKGSVVKNLTFTNAKTSFGGKLGGFIAGRVQGGTIENVTITVSFNGGYAVDGLINAGGMILGRLGESGSESVTVNKVTVIAADESTSNVDSTSPIANASNNDSYVPTKDKLVLNNVTLVGFKTLATWKNGTKLQTVEQLDEHFTCNNVVAYATVADYEAATAQQN